MGRAFQLKPKKEEEGASSSSKQGTEPDLMQEDKHDPWNQDTGCKELKDEKGAVEIPQACQDKGQGSS